MNIPGCFPISQEFPLQHQLYQLEAIDSKDSHSNDLEQSDFETLRITVKDKHVIVLST